MTRKLRADNAIDSVFNPYCAAKYGGDPLKRLMDDRGSFFIDMKSRHAPNDGYTPEELSAARSKMKSIINHKLSLVNPC